LVTKKCAGALKWNSTFDVSKTASQLEKASLFLHEVASQGKSILWVGTKKAARDIIQETATGLGMPYVVHRWIGGTLSNNSQVKKSVTKLLHYEDILAKS
jgi:small subunit ribosomal protein S2